MTEWGLGIYDGDLLGYRQCNTATGLCEDIAFKGSAFVGNQCVRSEDCQEGLICIGGWLIDAPEEHGFCARYCNPDPNLQAPDNGCDIGQGCEYFLSIGYCFPSCVSNSCGGANQVCATADPGAAGTIPGQEWQMARCIQCELSSLACGTPADAGVPDSSTGVDAATGSDAGAGSDAGSGTD